MTPEEIIEKAREEWCVERRGVRGLSQETDHTPACPPKVVAALLTIAEHAQIMGMEIAASGSLSRNTMEGRILHDGLGDLLADLDAAIEKELSK